MAVQSSLFHPFAVIVAWGRRDTEFQRWRVLPTDNLEKAKALADKIIRIKLKRGYQIHEEQEIK